jgi:hypothetical protein
MFMSFSFVPVLNPEPGKNSVTGIRRKPRHHKKPSAGIPLGYDVQQQAGREEKRAVPETPSRLHIPAEIAEWRRIRWMVLPGMFFPLPVPECSNIMFTIVMLVITCLP